MVNLRKSLRNIAIGLVALATAYTPNFSMAEQLNLYERAYLRDRHESLVFPLSEKRKRELDALRNAKAINPTTIKFKLDGNKENNNSQINTLEDAVEREIQSTSNNSEGSTKEPVKFSKEWYERLPFEDRFKPENNPKGAPILPYRNKDGKLVLPEDPRCGQWAGKTLEEARMNGYTIHGNKVQKTGFVMGGRYYQGEKPNGKALETFKRYHEFMKQTNGKPTAADHKRFEEETKDLHFKNVKDHVESRIYERNGKKYRQVLEKQVGNGQYFKEIEYKGNKEVNCNHPSDKYLRDNSGRIRNNRPSYRPSRSNNRNGRTRVRGKSRYSAF